MNRLKSTLLAAAGVLIPILLIALVNSGGVRGDDIKNVNVVNTGANPVPTSANPTVLLFQTPAGGVHINQPQDITDIDVSRFREIRLVLVNHPSSGGSNAAARVQLQVVEAANVVGNLDTLIAATDFSIAQENTSVTKAYTIPARNLKIRAEALLDPAGQIGHVTVDLLVFGN